MVTFNYFTSDKASTKFQGKIGFVNNFSHNFSLIVFCGHNADLGDQLLVEARRTRLAN